MFIRFCANVVRILNFLLTLLEKCLNITLREPCLNISQNVLMFKIKCQMFKMFILVNWEYRQLSGLQWEACHNFRLKQLKTLKIRSTFGT